MKGNEIRIGSRGSALALAQARLVLQALDADGRSSRIVTVETEGDRRAPDTAWGEGAFVAAIERALLMGRVDVAVHSAKDVPTDEDPRLRIGAYLPRADARDALVVRAGADRCGVDDLPAGARVGTDSPRRTGFLLARRPDLVLHPLHGNVDTRLRRLDSAETDALILACAGLDRLGLGDRIAERISPEIAPPAPGQGAIALQIRRDDARMIALTAAIDHRPTRMAVEAERAFLAASGGGCRSPIGAFAVLEGGELMFLGGHARPDGSATALGRRRGAAADAEAMGRELALELDTRMSRLDIATRLAASKTTRSRVIVTRAAEQSHALAHELDDVGLEPVIVPTIAVELEPPGGELDRCLQRLDDYRWIVCTSANGARAILAAASSAAIAPGMPCWAVIGPATRRVLEREGIHVDFQPSESSASALSQELPIRPQDAVLVVRGDLADQELAVTLRARGASVDDVVAYRTHEAPEESRTELRRAMSEGPIAAVVFTSGSSLRGLLALGNAESLDVRSIPCVCIGPETALEARAASFRVLAISPSPESAALAATCALALAAHPQETS